jgi:DtxR family manganese transport transcriptional regulator
MSESKRFLQTREAHRFELAEDYVETILDLIDEDGHAKLTELATRFGVTHPTVFKSLRRLEAEGLVVLQPYKSIELTNRGLSLARHCRKRHEIVVNFLRNLGLDAETAEIDAEGIEHHVSEQTLALMAAYELRDVAGQLPEAPLR